MSLRGILWSRLSRFLQHAAVILWFVNISLCGWQTAMHNMIWQYSSIWKWELHHLKKWFLVLQKRWIVQNNVCNLKKKKRIMPWRVKFRRCYRLHADINQCCTNTHVQIIIICIKAVSCTGVSLWPTRFAAETQQLPLEPSCGLCTGPCGWASSSRCTSLPSSSPCTSGTAPLAWPPMEGTGCACSLTPQPSISATPYCLDALLPPRYSSSIVFVINGHLAGCGGD